MQPTATTYRESPRLSGRPSGIQNPVPERGDYMGATRHPRSKLGEFILVVLPLTALALVVQVSYRDRKNGSGSNN
jgi:hypothetical protein